MNSKEWNRAHPDKMREASQNWKLRNPEKIKAYYLLHWLARNNPNPQKVIELLIKLTNGDKN